MTPRNLCLAALLISLCALTARADAVTLTGGTVSVEDLCSSFPEGTVDVRGDGFSVYGRSAGTGCFSNGDPFFSFSYFSAGPLSYQGQSYTYFHGGVTLGSTSLSGRVVVYADAFNRTPLFTIDFTGVGTRTAIPTGGSSGRSRYVFVVGSPVPEPSSILLLAAGVTGVGAAVRRRRRGKVL